MSLGAQLTALVAAPLQGKLARWSALLPAIEAHGADLQPLADQQLRKQSLSLRYRAKSHEPLDRLLPEAYALVREAGRRTLGVRHFDVQMVGGIAMHHRSIVEMQTGEGKTLTATLPLYLNALSGRGAHLATVNDYLARRDAEWMGPIYEILGLKVGVLQSQMSPTERRAAYSADITYISSGELAFDFLRDRLLQRRITEGRIDVVAGMLGAGPNDNGELPVQRGLHFVLVDEADSILIDDARTPMYIYGESSQRDRDAAECFRWAAQTAPLFKEHEHYTFHPEKRAVYLTAAGRKLSRGLLKPPAMDRVGVFPVYEYLERALQVDRLFVRERDYVVRGDDIVIVDESSGRLAEGCSWLGGTHQAIQAKEGAPIAVTAGQAARMTVQSLFLRYEKLCGMTGTASSAARELRKIYEADVVRVPTNRPAIRQRWPDRIFGTSEEKWAAIVEEARDLHEEGRPVLIGTRSIDKSTNLSQLLTAAGIEHQVLNAYHIAAEAEIIAAAGRRGQVTVSTNMAGRGTDIKLGEGVADLGGLHVILTEMHEAARTDRQLIGRCGRQGDPGSFRQYLSLDDDVLAAGLGPERARWLEEFGKTVPGPFEHLQWAFRKAQRTVERQHFRDRRALMHGEKARHKLQQELGLDPYIDSTA